MKKYKCWYGLGGGFGGARDFEIEEFESEANAIEYAWEASCDYYNNHVGMYGLRDYEQIAEEEELDIEKDCEEIEAIYEEEREGWLDYWAEEVNGEESEDN